MEEMIYICEICQTQLEEHHCKAICPNCGRTFDCSDLPLIQANALISEREHKIIPRPGGERDLLPKTSDTPDEKPAPKETKP